MRHLQPTLLGLRENANMLVSSCLLLGFEYQHLRVRAILLSGKAVRGGSAYVSKTLESARIYLVEKPSFAVQDVVSCWTRDLSLALFILLPTYEYLKAP